MPVEVLARRLPDGWLHLPPAAPAWWTGDAPIALRKPAPSERPAHTRSGRQQPALFDAAEPTRSPARPGWVGNLLTSSAFLANRQRARLPRPLADERLRRYLELIDANGGAIPLAALSARTGEPQDTLRMALTLVQRLLNLDGAEVLAVRADGTVALNRELLAIQFEVNVS